MAVNWTEEMAFPNTTLGMVDGVTVNAGAMVTRKVAEAVLPAESVAVTTMLKVPALVGVPLKPPAVERVSPGGSPVAVKVKVPKPPLAVTVAL